MIDASVIAKLIMREENYVEAAKEVEANDETLDIAILEVANVILKYHMREMLSAQEAQERFEELMELSETLRILDFKKFLEQAFETAIATNLTIYDSLYIASSSKLVTSDVKQATWKKSSLYLETSSSIFTTLLLFWYPRIFWESFINRYSVIMLGCEGFSREGLW